MNSRQFLHDGPRNFGLNVAGPRLSKEPAGYKYAFDLVSCVLQWNGAGCLREDSRGR